MKPPRPTLQRFLRDEPTRCQHDLYATGARRSRNAPDQISTNRAGRLDRKTGISGRLRPDFQIGPRSNATNASEVHDISADRLIDNRQPALHNWETAPYSYSPVGISGWPSHGMPAPGCSDRRRTQLVPRFLISLRRVAATGSVSANFPCHFVLRLQLLKIPQRPVHGEHPRQSAWLPVSQILPDLDPSSPNPFWRNST